MNRIIKSSELLIEAKKTISIIHPYICCNVSEAAKKLLGDYYHEKAINIRTQIDRDLGNADTYATWYHFNYGGWISTEETVEARLQWIDALIEYYQKQGD